MTQEEIEHRDELFSEYSSEEISGCLILVTKSSVNHQRMHVLELGALLYLFQPNLYVTVDF